VPSKGTTVHFKRDH